MSDSQSSGNSTGSGGSQGNSSHTEAPKPPVKPPRFGLVELGIFIALWVAMIVAFKVYTRASSRKRKSWFGENEEKKQYELLLREDPDNEEALKKALVKRAMTDVRRLMKLEEERESVTSLGRAGALSEEMMLAFKAAEKELQLEIFELQAEAETFKKDWGQEIIRDAVRLVKIEDELTEVKRRKEREDRLKLEEAERKEKDKVREAKLAEKDSQERKQLLEELLNEEEALSATDASTSAPSKIKKRSGSGIVKK